MPELLRPFRRDPGFSALALVTLAIGLGAVVTIFSVVNGVLLEQLPYHDPERLVFVDHESRPLELPSMGISRKLYLHYVANAQTLEGIGLYDSYQATLTGDGPPERVAASNATPSYFTTLGVRTQAGRLFLEEEGLPDAPPLVLLTDPLWTSRYGRDRSLIGRTIRVDGEAHEVVGVLAPRSAPDDVLLFRNRRIDPSNLILGSFNDVALARRKPDADLEAVRADFDRMLANLSEKFPDERSAEILERADFRARIEPLLDRIVGPVKATLWVLLGTVSVILLIACSNVANLFLVRVEERSNELALRSALGASRLRLVGGLLLESLVLSLAAGVLGLAVAVVATELIQSYGPQSLPRLDQVEVDGRVALFALVLSLLAGVVFGLLPALRGTAARIAGALKDGGRSATAGRERHWLRNALVTAQVALGLLLLVASGLLVRTLIELRQVDPGFDTTSALSFRVTLPELDYPDPEQRAAFVEQALERLRALPGIEEATVASGLPLDRNTSGSGYAVEEHPVGPDQLPPVFMQTWVAPGHVRSMGMSLLEGRDLEPYDHQQRSGNVLVSAGIARRFWPSGGAVGKRITAGNPEDELWYTIVGVVADVHDFGLNREPPLRVYRPLLGLEEDQADLGGGLSFVLRTTVEPRSLLAAARAEIWALDPNLPISSVQTLEELVADSQAQMSFTVVVLVISAGLALLLAAIGLYGVISYIVTKRHHEFGVRLALGARRRDVIRMVVRGGLLMTTAGMVIGLGLAVGLTRVLDSILFGVGALDPATFLSVPILLFTVALLASYLPARRASRVPPADALRADG